VLRAVDGPGSGVDADTLDGHGSADFIVTALQLRNALVSVDGTGSELDFDLLDGLDSSQLLRADQDCRVAGNLTVQGWVKAAAPQADADLATKSYVDGQVLPGQPCPAGEVVRGYDPGGTATCVQAGPPVVSGITPERGPASGGTVVTVTGGGFRPGVRVFVGTSEAGNVVVVDGASLTALTGVAQQTGIRQAVSVVSAGGLAGVLPAAFSYESEAPGL
ncbi:MAG: hypothetical protein FJ125_04315, partial [Deltaproteobacteria bacterium]|nr:hypothetical protein [Deltaproteobacteria bacterium]